MQFILMKLSSDRYGIRDIIRYLPMLIHHPCESHIFLSPVTFYTNTVTNVCTRGHSVTPKNTPYRDFRPLEGKIPSRGHFMPRVWSKANPLEDT